MKREIKFRAWDKNERQSPYWSYIWHIFIDHLIAEKDPEEFFKKLLK